MEVWAAYQGENFLVLLGDYIITELEHQWEKEVAGESSWNYIKKYING